MIKLAYVFLEKIPKHINKILKLSGSLDTLLPLGSLPEKPKVSFSKEETLHVYAFGSEILGLLPV